MTTKTTPKPTATTPADVLPATAAIDPATNYTVETYTELPASKTRPLSFPVDKLAVGQCLRLKAFTDPVAEKKAVNSLRNCATTYGKRHEKLFIVRKDAEGRWGCYRVALPTK